MKKPKACIIIPTYNERKNMPIILDRLLSVFSKIKDYQMYILIVDDNSPDGTANIVEEYCKKHRNIRLLNRKKKIGLGAAYIAGFRYVFENIDANVIFQMDADLSHTPERIPEFLKQINNGYNFVIGSRYIPGGRVVGWTIDRKLTSKTGNIIARHIAGVSANDCTSGFRAIKTDLLKRMNFDGINIKGYAFLIGLLHRAVKNGARIKEIPISFRDRKYGQTKLSKSDMKEFLISCIKMRFKC